MNKELVYLAIPYSHRLKSIRQKRFETANRVAGKLMQEGYIVFSPISHSHPIAQAYKLPTGWKYWLKFDSAFLRCSKKLIVLCIKGWKESVGVQGEIKLAKQFKIPIEYITE